LVLDLARVSGVDSSAIRTVARMSQLGASNGFEVLVAGTAPAILERLERGGVDGVTFTRDVDEALERSEDALLASLGGPSSEHAPAWLPGDLRVAGLDRYVEPVTASPGQVLLRRGEPVRELYLLRSGRLSVQVARPDGTTLRLRTMLPGVVVGEVSLYLGDGASADVVADTTCELLRIRRDELARLEREEPDVAARVHRWFATILAQRLSETLATLDAGDD
jgi:SulP family sulfate permease